MDDRRCIVSCRRVELWSEDRPGELRTQHTRSNHQIRTRALQPPPEHFYHSIHSSLHFFWGFWVTKLFMKNLPWSVWSRRAVEDDPDCCWSRSFTITCHWQHLTNNMISCSSVSVSTGPGLVWVVPALIIRILLSCIRDPSHTPPVKILLLLSEIIEN